MFAFTKKIQNKKLKYITRFLLASFFCVVLQGSFFSYASSSTETMTPEHQQWLKEQFSEQHKKLIPVVAVADMFYGCNQERKVETTYYPLKNLITQMDKKQLAEKLSACLGKDEIKSEQALNFGLIGCFNEQLSDLPDEEKKQKMTLVEKAILSLSRTERQKSFTKCVNAQAIHYLK